MYTLCQLIILLIRIEKTPEAFLALEGMKVNERTYRDKFICTLNAILYNLQSHEYIRGIVLKMEYFALWPSDTNWTT